MSCLATTTAVLPDRARKVTWTHIVLLVGCILVARLIYLCFLSPWPLVADEAHYWEWSRRPDFSYYTKGPGVAWVIWLSVKLLGTSAGAVRVPAAIASAFMMLVAGRLAFDITRGNALAAAYATCAVALMPGYLGTSQLLTTDVFYSAGWIATAWCAFHAVRTDATPMGRLLAWIGVGACIGGGVLFKYTALLILPGLIGWLWTSRRHIDLRRCATGALAAIVTFILCASPVAIWNARHGWPTIAHQLGRLQLPGGDESVRWGWSPIWFLSFVGAQLGLLGVVGAVLIALAVAHERRRRRDAAAVDERALGTALLLWCAAPLLATYLLLSLFKPAQGNWAIAGYTTPLVLVGIVLADVLPVDARRRLSLRAAWHWYVGVGLAAGVVLLLGPAFLRLPGVRGIAALQKVEHRLNEGVDGAIEVDALRARLARPGVPLLVIADSYQRASLLAFYLHDRPRTFAARHVLGGRPTAYDFFADTNLRDARLRGSDALLIGADRDRWSAAFAFASIESVPGASRTFIARSYGGLRDDGPATVGTNVEGDDAP